MKHIFFKANERGVKDLGWLKSNFAFSFSDYYDPAKSAFGSLVAFNDDYIQPQKGFGTHPHQNMEIISVMLAGTMSHKDDMGYDTTVKKDAVQIMSAGAGLFHEEWNVGEEEVNFLQIWIQPKLQNIKPRYQTRYFPQENRVNKLQTIVSGEEGQEHCWINQNAKLSLGYYNNETSVRYSLNKTNKCVFIFCIQGELNIGTNNLQKKDAIGIWDESELVIDCKKDTEFVIIETVVNQK